MNHNNLTCAYYDKAHDELMLGFYGNFSYVYYINDVARELLEKTINSLTEIPEEGENHIMYYHPQEVLILNRIDLAAVDQLDNKLRVWFNSGNDFLEIHSPRAEEMFERIKNAV
jgi:hypothetical protein